MKIHLFSRLAAASLFFVITAATVGGGNDIALAASVCRPGTEATCRPIDAVDAADDYLYYLKQSTLDKIAVDALYELFTTDVRKKLSRRKFAGLLEDFLGSSFSLTAYTIDTKVTPMDTGEVACRASLHYVVYPNGILTSRSMEVVLHARFEEGEWRLSRLPSYSGGFEYRGMFP